MEKEQFDRMVVLLEKQIEYLQAILSQLEHVDESIQRVFLK